MQVCLKKRKKAESGMCKHLHGRIILTFILPSGNCSHAFGRTKRSLTKLSCVCYVATFCTLCPTNSKISGNILALGKLSKVWGWGEEELKNETREREPLACGEQA